MRILFLFAITLLSYCKNSNEAPLSEEGEFFAAGSATSAKKCCLCTYDKKIEERCMVNVFKDNCKFENQCAWVGSEEHGKCISEYMHYCNISEASSSANGCNVFKKIPAPITPQEAFRDEKCTDISIEIHQHSDISLLPDYVDQIKICVETGPSGKRAFTLSHVKKS